jgi:hypothetical protein
VAARQRVLTIVASTNAMNTPSDETASTVSARGVRRRITGRGPGLNVSASASGAASIAGVSATAGGPLAYRPPR